MANPDENKIGQIIFDDGTGIARFVVFDIVTVETHEAPTDVTEYPVEEGANISDNVRPGLKRLELEGYVSRKPLPHTLKMCGELDAWGYEPARIQSTTHRTAGTRSEKLDLPEKDSNLLLGPGAVTSAVFGLIDSLSGPVSAQLTRYARDTENHTVRTFQQTLDYDRVVSVQERLNEIWENSHICSVLTSLEFYTDMVIENRVSKRTPADGSGATFSISLKKVQFVTSERIDMPDNPIIKKPLGSRNVQQTHNEQLYRDKLRALAAQSGPDSSAALMLQALEAE